MNLPMALLLAGLLSTCSFISVAEIKYLSLHQVESDDHQALSVKLNLVEQGQSLPLKFTLDYQGSEIALSYQKLNNYMLRVTSPKIVIGKAAIISYQLVEQQWQMVNKIDIYNQLTGTNTNNNAIAQRQAPTMSSSQEVQNSATANDDKCLLTAQPKETLWRIATRYMKQWQLDVYSAMIAIYQANLSQFAQQHIGQLNANAKLVCPSQQLLTSYGDKAAMKAKFHQLNNKH